ncbi:Nif3-like dinuclear metal center hexameric protein [bacterium]|nr:Nif3-like dinuclear metal center hexameric protein [bacterium]
MPTAKNTAKPKNPEAKVSDLVRVLHRLAPPRLAESWDNVGLQVGDPTEALGKVLVALEVTREVLAEARKIGAKTLVTHHPLIFRPAKSITPATPGGALLLELARSGLTLVAAHTNLDSVAWGTNGELADRLGLQAAGRQFLRPAQPTTDLLKYVVYTPATHVDAVIAAVNAAGAGMIGNYSHCTFRTEGTGTYLPHEGAHPSAGQVGKLESAAEVRLECVCPKSRIESLLREVRSVHPYEEIAYDLIPLANATSEAAGLGMLGTLAKPTTLAAFSKLAKKTLGLTSVGLVGDDKAPIERVAICTGAGGEIIRTWRRGEADVLVTGEMTHHDCADAHQLGVPVVLVGHWASEAIVSPRLAGTLAGALAEEGFADVSIVASSKEVNPLRRVN